MALRFFYNGIKASKNLDKLEKANYFYDQDNNQIRVRSENGTFSEEIHDVFNVKNEADVEEFFIEKSDKHFELAADCAIQYLDKQIKKVGKKIDDPKDADIRDINIEHMNVYKNQIQLIEKAVSTHPIPVEKEESPEADDSDLTLPSFDDGEEDPRETEEEEDSEAIEDEEEPIEEEEDTIDQESLIELVKKSFYDKLSLNRTLINNSPVEEEDSIINFFFEFPTGKRNKDLFQGRFDVSFFEDDKLSVNIHIPICYAVDDGKRILCPMFEQEKESHTADRNEEGIKQAIDLITETYNKKIEESRESAVEFEKIPTFSIEDDINCQQLGDNFIKYSRGNLFMTVYQHITIKDGDEEKISFYYNIYQKTFNNKRGGGVIEDQFSYLLLPELILRAG